MIRHPLLTSLNQVDALLTRLEGALSFTPSDRGRLGLAEVTALDKLEGLNAKRERRQRERTERRRELDAEGPPKITHEYRELESDQEPTTTG